MKRFSLIIISISAFMCLSALMYSGNSPGNKTDSPFDGSNCSQCHASTPQVVNWITSTIPLEGYMPGQTYTITLHASSTTNNKFGFECTCENSSGPVGSYTITNSTDTKYLPSSNSVTHSSAGTAGTSNEKTWSFDWTSPNSGTGDVTIYAAFVSSNNSGNTQGDQVYKSQIAVSELYNTINAIENINSISKQGDFLVITIKDNKSGLVTITNIEGKQLLQKPCNSKDNISIKTLPKGNYIAILQVGSTVISSKFKR